MMVLLVVQIRISILEERHEFLFLAEFDRDSRLR